jgi:hypothetical protein
MLRRDENNVVRALAWNRYVREHQGLRINKTVQGTSKDKPETVAVDSGWR